MNQNRYMNISILIYFWNKIKTYISGLFALDENVVHKSGNETITDTKVFSSIISGNISGSSGSCTGNAATATKINTIPSGTTYVGAATKGNALVNSGTTGFGAVWNAPTKNYRVGCATYPSSNDQILWYSITNNNITAGTNTVTKSMNWNADTGILTATGFSGSLTGNVTGNVSGTSSNVTGTVAIANGGTGATTRLNALKNLTNENVGTDAQYFLTITSSWGKGGYTSLSNAATILGTAFTTGTRMLFQQTAAPTGWTKETGSGYNNIALRLTTGTIANKTNGKAFTTCMASGRTSANATQGGSIANTTATGSLSKTKAGGSNANATQGGTISNTTAGGTVGNKALSVAMLAAHTHSVDWSGSGSHDKYPYDGTGGTVINSGSTGSGSNHNHSFTGTAHGHTFTGAAHTHTFTGTEHTHTFTGTAHNHTFTGSAHNHTLDLDINYIDCIIAVKA